MTDLRRINTVYIDGEWTPSASDGRIDVVNPATEQTIATVPNGGPDDVDRAVMAARRSFESWSLTSIGERVAILQRVRDGLLSRAEEIAQTLAGEMGSPLWFGRQVQVPLPLRNLELAIQAIGEMALEEPVINSLVVREPIGVVAGITPWNAPLHQIVAKAGAALAAGCTIVVKPSEVAPLNCVIMAEIMDAAGVPPGVFNVVFGDGPGAGEALVTHAEVDMVSFTGSVRGGRRVAELAGSGVKKVTLELGGKSATIALDDAALEIMAPVVLRQCFANSGQVCSAQTRLLVPRRRLHEAESLLLDGVSSWIVGDPFAPDTRLGPIVTRTQHRRVIQYIEAGMAEGARLLCGGTARPAGLARGYYVAPTIFSDVVPGMTIAREEIFGPVLSVIPYDTVEEAIRIANSLPYGLSGGVWSADKALALSVARRMRTGQVILNGAAQNLAAPFGGFKQSGIGRENGRFGIEEFFQLKAIQGGV